MKSEQEWNEMEERIKDFFKANIIETFSLEKLEHEDL